VDLPAVIHPTLLHNKTWRGH